MACLGIDVYGGNGPVNFAQAKAATGIEFGIAKATEGVTFNDLRFADNWAQIQAANLQPGAYHFARPDNNTAQAEAQHFLSVLGDRRGIIALDLERLPYGWSLAQLAAWARTWLDMVRQATGIIPFLYTYHRWAFMPDFDGLRAAYPLWVPLDPLTPREITQTARTLGTLGTLDVDTYAGTLSELLAEINLAPAVVQPAPPVPVVEEDTMVLVRDPSTGREYLQVGTQLCYLGSTASVTAYAALLGHQPEDVDPGDLRQFTGYVQ